MAASAGKLQSLSKAEYLKRYLESDGNQKGDDVAPKKKKKKRKPEGKGLRIVDDDADDWKRVPTKAEEVLEDDDEPVVAEFVDERPVDVKRMEEFRTSNKWKVIQDESSGLEKEDPESRGRPEITTSPTRTCNNSPLVSDSRPSQKGRRDSDCSPPRGRHDSPDSSPPRKGRHDSPDLSPPRKGRHDSPDLSPPRKGRSGSHPHKDRHRSPNNLPSRRGKHDSSKSKKNHSPGLSSSHKNRRDSPDLSPARKTQQKRDSDSDLSPPRHTQRRRNASDSDLSPPRSSRRKDSDSDLSPPRRRNGAVAGPVVLSSKKDAKSGMLSGGQAGLISAEVLREEKEQLRKAQKDNKHLEDDSMKAETVFRDKSGKRRDLKAEREEQHKKQALQDKKEKQYAEWGKGLAQKEKQQQNLEEAAREIEKPLARYADDADLDQMLREREREGDPMAKFLQKKKEKENTGKNERPRYKGTNPPPNRYNIWPGYRWDGVDRSNGFEKQYFARQSDSKSMQEAAYKWSVEDM
ncbi:BUD13 homolog isoform X2 [Spea bombifrons]|uniref:BUD13 homolog isoform X2 n=1 Tax=Spea bombifrons TaxID=233779 RepID=UPI00234998B4|nr:BUD13 homolog isoform X2 [Spea bombifrons]